MVAQVVAGMDVAGDAAAGVEDSILVAECFELVNANQFGPLWERLKDEQRARNYKHELPSRLTRQPPKDPRDFFLSELEEYGVEYRTLHSLEVALLAWSEAAGGEAGVECLTLGSLCKYSAEDLRGAKQFGESALRQLRQALKKLRLRLRGD